MEGPSPRQQGAGSLTPVRGGQRGRVLPREGRGRAGQKAQQLLREEPFWKRQEWGRSFASPPQPDRGPSGSHRGRSEIRVAELFSSQQGGRKAPGRWEGPRAPLCLAPPFIFLTSDGGALSKRGLPQVSARPLCPPEGPEGAQRLPVTWGAWPWCPERPAQSHEDLGPFLPHMLREPCSWRGQDSGRVRATPAQGSTQGALPSGGRVPSMALEERAGLAAGVGPQGQGEPAPPPGCGGPSSAPQPPLPPLTRARPLAFQANSRWKSSSEGPRATRP